MCRMSADSTFLVDKQPPGYSSKLDELAEMLDQLLRENDRKVLLFSEWTTMLNLIEPLLEARRMNYVRLDGSVPQKKRQELIHRFGIWGLNFLLITLAVTEEITTLLTRLTPSSPTSTSIANATPAIGAVFAYTSPMPPNRRSRC